jgi:hypothetical protein
MDSAALLAQALGIAYTAGINLPATVAILGLTQRAGWVGSLPGGLDVLANPWVIGLALALMLIDFIIMLVPGIASLWETALTFVRPVAATVLAVSTVYHLDAVYLVLAGLVGGGLAITTHGAKLGVRYAVDTTPEPVTNFALNVTELAGIATICLAMWRHPYITLAVAVAVLVILIVVLRRVWRAIKRAFGADASAASSR